MKPSVLLDVAFLGHARGVQRGAERVARHLFEGLLTSGACDLSFVATSHLAGAYDFLKSQGVDPDDHLHFDRAQLVASRIARAMTTRVHGSISNRALSARAERYALSQVARVLQDFESSFPARCLLGAQIYHSPHTPFPPAVHHASGLRRFITCHDFIPFRHPEYFPSHIRHFMDGVLKCLQPENFAFCVSEVTRNDVLTYSKMPPERVFVTPLAADPGIFHPVTDPERRGAMRKRYGLGEQPYFLALSAHDPHKNFGHLIKCFGTLLETGGLPDGNLVIVGPNPGRKPEVQASLDKHPAIAARIRIPGFVPDEDLAAIYSDSTAFLFPSFAEGFGIPPLEAMQCGVPVIASNTTSMPEVVGDAGILLAPSDVDAWCDAIVRLAQDSRLRADLSQRSLARARLFSWQRFLDETLRGYRASLTEF